MTDSEAAASTAEARKWASICHLSALVGLLGNGIGYIIGPLAVWLIKRDEDPFIDDQGKEALNFQITMFIAAVISAILIIAIIGFFLLGIVLILMTVMPIIAAVKASDGELYRYPLTIRLIK